MKKAISSERDCSERERKEGGMHVGGGKGVHVLGCVCVREERKTTGAVREEAWKDGWRAKVDARA